MMAASATKSELKSIIVVKPSSPTPPHLQIYKLSFLDQRFPNSFFNINLFYPCANAIHGGDDTGTLDHTSNFCHRSKLLQHSLSQTLTLFYHFAGRFQDDATIICNDEGVAFMESEVNFSLSDILTSPGLSIIDSQLLPIRYPQAYQSFHGCMMLINFILFACGGTAICISNTHKIADMTTWMTFLNTWCASSRGLEPPVIMPDLHIVQAIFPARGVPQIVQHSLPNSNTTMRRFVFRASKVQELKSRLLSNLRKEGYENFYPSRVDAVTALIWRCLVISSKSITGEFRPSVIFKAVDPRMRMDPPLPVAMGNMARLIPMICEKESELELCELLKKMMTLKLSFERRWEKFNGEQLDEFLKEEEDERKKKFDNHKGEVRIYVCSTYCKFGIYELDFAGMGKPVWVTSVAPETYRNYINLTDTKEEGEVEALVYSDEEELNALACNEELLQFAELNPSLI